MSEHTIQSKLRKERVGYIGNGSGVWFEVGAKITPSTSKDIEFVLLTAYLYGEEAYRANEIAIPPEKVRLVIEMLQNALDEIEKLKAKRIRSEADMQRWLKGENS